MYYSNPIKDLSCLVLIACCVALGCSDEGKGPQRAAVCGTVTVDGQPVENGMIQFTPTEGTTGPVAGAVIENGEYSAEKKRGPVVGTQRVEISGNRKTGNKIKNEMGMVVDERVSVVPEAYNAQSTLVRQVESGKNIFDFPLNSDGSTQ